MELRQFISSFKTMHELARKGELSERDRQTYLSQREELARALVAAQRLTVQPGQTARACLRIARALQIDIDLPDGRVRAMTMQVSSGGFGALLAKEPSTNVAHGFTLKVPASTEPIVGRAKVVDVQKRVGNCLVSFAFEPLNAADQERMEIILFDTVIQQLAGAK